MTDPREDDRPVLVDTVALLLWSLDDPRLGRRAEAVMRSALERPVHVSVISAFEMATKVRLGKLAVPPRMLDAFELVVAENGFRLVTLDARVSVHGGTLAGVHKDPFDRLLAAQALALGAAVLTPDAAFARDLGVETIW